MPLKGELSDLSLAELIEFFCNQKKTGRLTVSYPHAPAYFYLQSGSVLHASIGSLRGIEAVYYALTQSNASFQFSTAYEAPVQTINQPWTSVVLEGLRRMDEGIEPRNPFPETSEPFKSEPAATAPPSLMAESSAIEPPPGVDEPPPIEPPLTFVAPAAFEPPPDVVAPPQLASPVTNQFVEAAPVQQKIESTGPVAETVAAEPRAKAASHRVEANSIQAEVSASKPQPEVVVKSDKQDKLFLHHEPKHTPATKPSKATESFLSSTQDASQFAHRPWKVAAIFAALVLIIAGVAIPWSLRVRGKSAKAAEQPAVVASESPESSQSAADSEAASQPASSTDAQAQTVDSNEATPASDPAEAARRAREARAREEARLKAKGEESAGTTNVSGAAPASASTSAPAASGSGPKKAVVQVTYDENGRVTQASGSDPTALRIARQKRFPPGKAGSTTITIPIN